MELKWRNNMKTMRRKKSQTMIKDTEPKDKAKGYVDGGKNTLKQRETLPILHVPIRLTNVWYGRRDGIMDPLPFKFGGCSVL